MRRLRLLAGLIGVTIGLVAIPGRRAFLTADEPRAGNQPAAAAVEEESKFIRVRRDEKNRPAAMETAVVRYTSAERPGVAVDLVGAVHVGDKAYYDELNKL